MERRMRIVSSLVALLFSILVWGAAYDSGRTGITTAFGVVTCILAGVTLLNYLSGEKS